jgi:hypothetical protein
MGTILTSNGSPSLNARIHLPSSKSSANFERPEFKNRFGDFRAYKEEFRLFVAPFDIDVNDVPTWFQMEAIELQCSEELKAKFSSCSLFNFY